MTAPLVSLIIPAYNERHRIRPTLDAVVAYLAAQSHPWEVVVVDDGSTDGTSALVQERAEHEPRVRLTEGPHLGKGAAVRRGMEQAHGEYLFLCDADLSMPIEHLRRFLPPALGGYDVAIASREVPGARRFGEPALRHIQGRVFNWLVRVLVVRGYRDTQCGFKCLRAEAAGRLLPLQRLDGFSFDAELLFLARKHHLRIVEVPIDWYYRSDSRVRPVIDALRMTRDLLGIRWHQVRGHYRSRKRRPTRRDAGSGCDPGAEQVPSGFTKPVRGDRREDKSAHDVPGGG